MRKISLSHLCLAAALLALAACGKSDQQKKLEEAAKQMEEAGKQMADAMGAGGANLGEAVQNMGEALGGRQAAEAVDFRELRALLPEELSGMKRSSAEGERNSAMGFTISTAEGRFEGENGSSISITITDVGAMTGAMAMATYAWTMAQIDRETDSEYERTVKIKGAPGFEKYNKDNRSGQIQVLVGGRFVVEVDGNDVSINDLKSALDKMDLGKLASMKDVGVK